MATGGLAGRVSNAEAMAGGGGEIVVNYLGGKATLCFPCVLLSAAEVWCCGSIVWVGRRSI